MVRDGDLVTSDSRKQLNTL
uniref:Uncharacterized protein n=1 Tax=Heterorhabditis bacteriophora TaxID=37862 RepID=A0A1I7WM87_HETBA